MTEPSFISRVWWRSFRTLQDLEIGLTPLHAFVGPNDSGKSTLVDGLENVMASAPTLTVHAEEAPKYRIVHGSKIRESWFVRSENSRNEIPEDIKRIFQAPARVLRLRPAAMRASSPLSSSPRPALGPDGAGVATVVDWMMSNSLDAWLEVRSRFRERFPTVRDVGAVASGNGKAVQIVLKDGTTVPAAGMSEGMLYWLTFDLLRYLAPPSMLLVEEPEAGLHPHRIHEVMGILRELSATTQVVITTHSPLVLNELHDDEVSVVRRHPELGTRVTPMTETHNFAARRKAWELGELWLAFANGVDEQDLLGPP